MKSYNKLIIIVILGFLISMMPGNLYIYNNLEYTTINFIFHLITYLLVIYITFYSIYLCIRNKMDLKLLLKNGEQFTFEKQFKNKIELEESLHLLENKEIKNIKDK